MRTRAILTALLLLSLLAPAPGLVSGAWAQGTATPPPAEPGGAEIDTIPADAIVLALKECINKALENNLDIAIRRYEPQNAQQGVFLSESVFDPSIGGNAIKRLDESKGAGVFGPFSSSPTTEAFGAAWIDPLTIGGKYRFDLGADDVNANSFSQFGSVTNLYYDSLWKFTFDQPLLRNLGRQVNTAEIVVAKNNLGISESQFRQTVLDIIAGAVKAYADLNFTILQLRTGRFSLKLAQDFLEQNRIKVRVGTLAPIEITQAEAQVADREESVIIEEAALQAAEDQIRQVIGMRKEAPDWGRPVRPSDPLILQEFEPSEETALTEAFAHRPDLAQARLDVQSRELVLNARKNQRRWGLDFEGTYGHTGFSQDVFYVDPATGNQNSDIVVQHGSYSDSLDDLRGRNQTNWSLGLALTVPIGNHQALANYGIAEANLAQSRYKMDSVEQQARLEVRGAVRAVETSMKRVKSGEVNVRLQREKLEAEQKKFENGMSTSFQVLQFQDDLSNAETRENLAKVDYNKALAELERVKGTLLDRVGVVLQSELGTGGRAPSTAEARTLLAHPVDLLDDPGLEIARRSGEAIHLPRDFTFGRATAVPAFDAN